MLFAHFDDPVTHPSHQEAWQLVERINQGDKLTYEEFRFLIAHLHASQLPHLQALAVQKRKAVYGDQLFIRGLMEISNICHQDCYYCGIRASNRQVARYAYRYEELSAMINRAYDKGYRTIVMQGGENEHFEHRQFCTFLRNITQQYPNLIITLSLGQKSKESYQDYYDAGARRYLLRHESADATHYAKLHPPKQTLASRMECLTNLKAIGFQTGAGFMVGSPYQTSANLAHDLLFLQDFQPHMVGIGPYMHHPDTPFHDASDGRLEHVLACYALARLIVPQALLPSTTATSSLHPQGRLRALQSGCNVIMINLSPEEQRTQYSLYHNKTYKGDESDEYLSLIADDVAKAGMEICMQQGNHSAYIESKIIKE
ncbi:[FeFe] hydrogenase H-cluster radical SAM maturase HydE [Entomospira culicis]|uniref:[FeFe] hydrogenase H-cluster radical SAM maturase HydE n=1 Tax=Entomospira culicis TaxID=2719989 RepID=A0A968GII1_9SPIO|nr:[FeFe] hydrogenase H-cluster radical SAM maturase HydE [Entomospira culicis]NIZ19070.1 [FeFe] hydrogenase H-cluster radical SAM maturase HydE [Entomospira culicis]NIZ69285.1 [FeFe] hydrogenase H-cluster radical SAM maturase HydE [Entomospira culicis]WDI37870.1 [FeFe] hydrogenase H-cluster radical SAM maturase HydE [Entomospira culicis]WDI39498.1 [FeFe] hydrogenase H-cluster radical SAM maturase HydE [Entomospira culicis]